MVNNEELAMTVKAGDFVKVKFLDIPTNEDIYKIEQIIWSNDGYRAVFGTAWATSVTTGRTKELWLSSHRLSWQKLDGEVTKILYEHK